MKNKVAKKKTIFRRDKNGRIYVVIGKKKVYLPKNLSAKKLVERGLINNVIRIVNNTSEKKKVKRRRKTKKLSEYIPSSDSIYSAVQSAYNKIQNIEKKTKREVERNQPERLPALPAPERLPALPAPENLRNYLDMMRANEEDQNRFNVPMKKPKTKVKVQLVKDPKPKKQTYEMFKRDFKRQYGIKRNLRSGDDDILKEIYRNGNRQPSAIRDFLKKYNIEMKEETRQTQPSTPSRIPVLKKKKKEEEKKRERKQEQDDEQDEKSKREQRRLLELRQFQEAEKEFIKQMREEEEQFKKQKEKQEPKDEKEETKAEAKPKTNTNEEMKAEQQIAMNEQGGDGRRKQGEGLSEVDINRVMNKYKKKGWITTIAADEIPTKILPKVKKNHSLGFIMNTAKRSARKGVHWVAVYISIKDASVEYFDSFGELPSKLTTQGLKQIMQKLDLPVLYKFKINRVQHQANSSDECGYFAMKFLMDRFKKVPFTKASGFDDRIQNKSKKYEKEIKLLKRLPPFSYI